MGKLHSWFKPIAWFALPDGSHWIANSWTFLRCPPFDPDLPEKECASGPVGNYIARAVNVAAPHPGPKGYVAIGPAMVNAHHVAMVESAFPGCEWRHGDDLDAVCAWLGGQCVAGSMPVRSAETKPRAPDCALCEGVGGPPCSECDGDKECACPTRGQDAECDACGGDGYQRTRGRCHGSGKWAPEHDAE